MKGKLNNKEAAKLLGCSARQARRLSTGGGLELAVKVGDSWYVSTEIPIRLTSELRFAMAPREKREGAIRRAAVVIACDDYLRLTKNEYRQRAAHQEFAAKKKVGVRSLYRWRAKYVSGGIAGLLDLRGGQWQSKR